ncbi:MAG: hypothetical protein AAF733_10170, partial [Verrucomicrobiota bacterium]
RVEEFAGMSAFHLNPFSDLVLDSSALITELRSILSQSHHQNPVDAGYLSREVPLVPVAP